MGTERSVRAAVAAETLGLDAEQMRRAHDLLHEQVESGRSPGLVAVVVRRGEVALAEAIGTRNSAGDPMGFDTVFPIASATKPLTAAVIMSLVEAGQVGLMQRVADYIPEIPEMMRDRLLVHHLLTHTGGYEAVTWNGRAKARMLEHRDDDATWGRDPLVNAYLGCIPGLEMKKPPGTGMLYANLGYEMLGEIVRKVTGDTLAAAMHARACNSMLASTPLCKRCSPRRHPTPARPIRCSSGSTCGRWRSNDSCWRAAWGAVGLVGPS